MSSARNLVDTLPRAFCYKFGMDTQAWQRRLLAVIEAYQAKTGVSDRHLSLQAKLGENYVNQFKHDPKKTRADTVVKLCDALNVSVTYIFTGADITPLDEEVIRLFASLPEDGKVHYLGILRGLQSNAAIPQ